VKIAVVQIEKNEDSEDRKNEVSQESEKTTVDAQRRGIINEGNTCYLASALQVLRNSLQTQDSNNREFAAKLKAFYSGEEQSLVSYLEKKFNVDLNSV